LKEIKRVQEDTEKMQEDSRILDKEIKELKQKNVELNKGYYSGEISSSDSEVKINI